MIEATMTFDKELKDWRTEGGLTQEQAAAYLDVPVRSLQEWEQGRSKPNQIGPIRKLIAEHKRQN